MSHSGSDSEGFESADDNEFDEEHDGKSTAVSSATSKTLSKNDKKSDAKETKTVEKFKALEVNNANNANDDIDDSWAWGDDDDDNYNFSSPAKTSSNLASTTKPQSLETKSERIIPKDATTTVTTTADPAVTPSESVISSSSTNSHSSKSSWAPWSGVVSLLSTASDGVASFTSHMSSVIESNIGVPDPMEIVQQQRDEKQQKSDKIDQATESDNGNDAETKEKLLTLGSFVSNVTQISNRVISGGLDTLEGIGKKTMTILQENDPGLMSKRKLLGLDNAKPVLSQVLREAKEKSEESEKNMKLAQKKMYRRQLHFETLFDDYHGLVHLEALEMLSKQSTIKLQSLLMPLTGLALSELQQTMNQVNELCELNELDQDESPDSMYDVSELEEKLKTATEDFDIPIDFKDILDTWKTDSEWLKGKTDNETEHRPQEIHDRALKCLAKTSALAVNKYHKLSELLLIKDHHSTVNEADCLIQLTNTFCWHLSGIATHFSGKLTNVPSTDPDIQTNTLITNIFLEGSKSTSYIQNAFQLFIPILQIGAV